MVSSKRITSNLSNSPNSEGIWPVNELAARLRIARLCKLPKMLGRDPFNLLACSCSSDSLTRFTISTGMDPDNRLFSRCRTSRFVISPISVLRVPANLFSAICKAVRPDNPDKSGMVPVKPQSQRDMYLTLCALLISTGIVELRWLLSNCSTSRGDCSGKISAGIDPVSSLDSNPSHCSLSKLPNSEMMGPPRRFKPKKI